MRKELLLTLLLAGQLSLLPNEAAARTQTFAPESSLSRKSEPSKNPGVFLKRTSTRSTNIIPLNVKATDNGFGQGTLLWQAPEATGNSAIDYNIYMGLDEEGYPIRVASGVKTCEYSFNIPTSGEQQSLYLGVSANENGLEGEIVFVQPLLLTGETYSIPFVESFPNAKMTHPTWRVSSKGVSWTFYLYTYLSSDNDGGSVKYDTYSDDDWSKLTSGKINLCGTINPVLEFDLFETPAEDDEKASLIISAFNPLVGEEVTLKTIELTNFVDSGWKRYQVSLASLRDCPYVTVSFLGECSKYKKGIILDNIVVRELNRYDISVKGNQISKVKGGSTIPIKVRITNEGEQAADSYRIVLYDRKEIQAIEGKPLKPQESYEIVLPYLVPVNYDGFATPEIRVEFPFDMEPDNDCLSLRFGVGKSDMPGIQNITLSESGVLSWEKPVIEKFIITEGFEEYDCWSITDLGQWSLRDLDRGIMSGIGYQGKIMPHFREPYAWIVWNPYEFELDLNEYPGFIPHNGEQFIATFNAFYPWELPTGSNDDWIISPELSGNPQEISFFVGKYLDHYGKEEKYEIWWSDGSTDPADFKLLATDEVERQKWYEVKYQLPEGAKRFAIRYVGVGQYAVFIDDITYEPPFPVLKGFNIYRNGIFEAFTEKESYQIGTRNSGDRYAVTALYENAESDLSEEMAYTSEIVPVIAINGEDSYIYYFINGQTAATNENTFRNLPSGVYLKKSLKSGKVTKIIKK